MAADTDRGTTTIAVTVTLTPGTIERPGGEQRPAVAQELLALRRHIRTVLDDEDQDRQLALEAAERVLDAILGD